MSNDEINKYKALYAQLVNEFAGLHNENLVFIRTRGRIPGYAIGRHLRNIAEAAILLNKQCKRVRKEEIANTEVARKAARDETKRQKLNKAAEIKTAKKEKKVREMTIRTRLRLEREERRRIKNDNNNRPT